VQLDKVGLFDFHKADLAIEQGRQAVRRYLSAIETEAEPTALAARHHGRPQSL
jgi:predicted acylesterase/phospholipase RssA